LDKSITWIAGSTVQLNLKYSNISMQNYWFIRLRQRTVSECPCYRWPRICSSKNRFRMSVLQITTNIFVKESLQNVRVTGCSGKVSKSCSDSDNCRVFRISIPVISHIRWSVMKRRVGMDYDYGKWNIFMVICNTDIL
jgi:hypothetical protein